MVLLVGPLLLFACKENPKTPPSAEVLSHPGFVKSPPISKRSSVKDVFPPAVTVKKIVQPLELQFSLFKTELKNGDSLWYHVQLKNLDPRDLIFAADFFHDPWVLHKNFALKSGFYFEIVAPDGNLVMVRHYLGTHPDRPIDRPEPPDPALQRELDEKVEVWKKEGLSSAEIHWEALNFVKSRTPVQGHRVIELAEGEVVESLPWVFNESPGSVKRRKPIGQFSELWMFEFPEPGEYSIRAVFHVYFNQIPKEGSDGILRQGLEETVKTPKIRFTVK